MNTTTNRLKPQIAAIIKAQGAISISQYTQICMTDAKHGYYPTRDPIGKDFITAPEITSLFGEIIAIWCINAWMNLNQPQSFALVELGPGHGTLMADIISTCRKLAPAFLDAVTINLIEVSQAMRVRQRKNLAAYDIQWHKDISALPALPTIIIANEFFDCLPIRQFIRKGKKWHERLITLNTDNRFCFIHDDDDHSRIIDPVARQAGDGAIFETAPLSDTIASTLAAHVARHGGAGLIIDYGYTQTATGDTWQAVHEHKYVDPLEQPGNYDLTAHVNFAQISKVIKQNNVSLCEVMTQGEFLTHMAITKRHQTAIAANPQHRQKITNAVNRLIEPQQMGNLFKVLAFATIDQLFPFGL